MPTVAEMRIEHQDTTLSFIRDRGGEVDPSRIERSRSLVSLHEEKVAGAAVCEVDEAGGVKLLLAVADDAPDAADLAQLLVDKALLKVGGLRTTRCRIEAVHDSPHWAFLTRSSWQGDDTRDAQESPDTPAEPDAAAA